MNLCSVETKRRKILKTSQILQETAQARVRLVPKPVVQEQNLVKVRLAKVVLSTTNSTI